ncbi:MAG: CapA family protein [Oscillospiraceae bacterium]|nr:CapA family protein [Oscillospiraceae bacterium]
MKRSLFTVFLIAALCLALMGCDHAVKAPQKEAVPPQTEAAPTETAAPTVETAAPTEPETTVPEIEPATEPETEPVMEPETEPATEPETQPEEAEETENVRPDGSEVFTLSFLGDCTIGSQPSQFNVMYSILWYIGEDYGYSFRNVLDYIDDDDLTVVNLEGTFCDPCPNSGARFTFRAPKEYVNVLTENSVEVASFANNHTMDYRQEGYDSTLATLEEAGVPYVEKDGSLLYTTESGLTVGFYALSFALDEKDMKQEIAQLRQEGAELVIVSAHWGAEGSYRAAHTQTEIAYAAIDAGADIVYGHHPHVLQKIEEYNGGIIYYSLGNFIFGGHHWPRDLDSAILQQQVIRSADGEVSLGELTILPVSISSLPAQNNFQPTPCEEGSEQYTRVLEKLSGTFTGPDLLVKYD